MTPHEKWILAQEYLVKRELPQALKLLNEAIEAEADNANFISERAVVYFHMGDKNMALMELDRAVALEPNNPYRYSSRAYVKSAMKMTKGAILDYEKCVALDPEDAVAYNNLGIILEAAGKIEDAKRHFNKADELEGILNERGISLAEETISVANDEVDGSLKLSVTQKTTTIATSEAEEIQTESSKPSKWRVVKSVFTNKNVFNEYLSFVKSGFKNKSSE